MPSTGAGKWTEFLTKSSKHFLPLIHLGVYVLTFVLCLVSLDKTWFLYQSLWLISAVVFKSPFDDVAFCCSFMWANMVIADEFVRAQFSHILYLFLIFFCYWLFISCTFACYIFTKLTYKKAKTKTQENGISPDICEWMNR